MWIPDLPKSKKNWKKALVEAELLTVLGVATTLVAMGVVIRYFYFTNTHLPPRTYINSIDVGGLTYEEAQTKVTSTLATPDPYQLTLDMEGISVASSSAELGLHYDVASVLAEIKNRTTTGKMRWQTFWRVSPLFRPSYETALLKYDQEQVHQFIAELNNLVSYEGREPQATLKISGNSNTIEIDKGQYGRAVDADATARAIAAQTQTKDTVLAATIASPGGELSETQLENATARVEKFVGKSIIFSYKNYDFKLSDKDMISLLTLPTGYSQEKIVAQVQSWKDEIDREPQEPVFEYDKESLKVETFIPPKPGLSLDENKTQQQLINQLREIEEPTANSSENDQDEAEETAKATNETRVTLEVRTTAPQKSLADTNDLGIKELIGEGDSHYDHSIPNRIHNVAITTERISDHLVAPGEQFSFNKTLGDVSAATGYRSAYVIKNGQTALGDGGGVCQVSTTLFRSVLNAGLKITRRLPHSYRVSYYELDNKPGVDATVYSGETDFRFINDTDNYILIHGEADSKNLYMYFDLYGTSDGRSTEIIDHKTWNYRPALPAEYIPDPSLPAGTLKQVDWAAPGISASFVNVIKDKDGNIVREDKYVSNYRPWSAKYLQGTSQ